MPLEKEFYTVKELAELLQVTPTTIYRLMNRGELAYHQVGRAKRFSREDVEEYLKRARRNSKISSST